MNGLGRSIWNIIENILVFLFKKVFRLNLSEKKWNIFLQFVKFAIVGVSNTVISYVIYLFSLFFFKSICIFQNTDYIVSQIIAFVLSVLWSFYWNNKYVFLLEEVEQQSIIKILLKTYVSYSFTGLFLNSILIILWVKIFYISKFVAPIINLIISVPLNFVINKYWAFKPK